MYKIYLYDNEYDCIGTGCLSTSYVQWQLAEASGNDVEVHISSLGGDAFQAVAIYNLLKSYSGKVTTYIDAVAASAAATIAMAGEEIIMSKYALLMIHKPSTFTGGTSDDLQADVAMLDAIQTNIVSIYMDKTGLPQDKVEELVNATTWLTADEALTLGFINSIQDYVETEPLIQNAGLVLNYVNNSAPKKYKQVINKILVKNQAPATKENAMTKEEIEAVVKPTENLIKKAWNFITGVSKKVATNKGDKFISGNLVKGTKVYNDADMDEPMEDGDMDVDDSAGNKTVVSVAGGEITNIVESKKKDPDMDDDEDDDIDADNKAVLNNHAINFKKTVTNKVLKNSVIGKLKEVSNKVDEQNALIVELRGQLKVSNDALQKNTEDIKKTIKSEFEPDNSKRSTKLAVNTATASWMPKEGTLAANASKSAVQKAEAAQ